MSNKHNVRRINKKLVSKGNTLGVEIFQNDADNLLYYKDTNGILVPLMTNESTEITSLQNSVAVIEAATTLYKETTISSAEILDLGSNSVELLPEPAVNEYYLIKDIVLEYTYDTGTYSVAVGQFLRIYFDNVGPTFKTPLWAIDVDSILEQSTSQVVQMFPTGLQNTIDTIVRDANTSSSIGDLTSSLVLDCTSSVTIGQPGAAGTMLAKVFYETRTFGTEL